MSSTAKKAKKKKAVAAPAISNVDAAAAPAISDADAAAAPAISNVDAADVAEEAKDVATFFESSSCHPVCCLKVPAVQNPENLLAALREEHRQGNSMQCANSSNLRVAPALEKASQQANVFKVL
jgi:hypothetical protein